MFDGNSVYLFATVIYFIYDFPNPSESCRKDGCHFSRPNAVGISVLVTLRRQIDNIQVYNYLAMHDIASS